MINNSINSLNMLKSFFENDLSELDLSDLVRIETSSSSQLWNSLIFNKANSNIKTLILKNLEQSPYILTLPNLTEVNLDNLLQVERGAWSSKNIGSNSSSNFYNNLKPGVLQNTKLSKLSLPNFVGALEPTCNNAISMEDSNYLPYTSFINNYWLQEVSLGNSKMFANDNKNFRFNGFWFNNNYFLKSLELNYPYVIEISKPEFFLNNPIKNGSGYIFVPNAELVSAYLETNWSILGDKIKPIIEKPGLMPVEIEDDWSEIVYNCRTNSPRLNDYHIGDIKTVMINNVATPFMLVGKNQDTIHQSYTGNYNTSRSEAHLSWMEATISRFVPENINQNDFNNNAIYNNAVNIHSILNTLYNSIIMENEGLGIDSQGNYGILPVYKRSKGYNSNTGNLEPNVLTVNPEFLWIPSAIEVTSEAGLSEGTFIYDYFNNSNKNLNYCFGYTNINRQNGEYIEVALRDYSATDRTSPDVLQASNSSPNKMSIVSSSSAKTSYLITGFCT